MSFKKDVPIDGISALKLSDMVAPKSANVAMMPKCLGESMDDDTQ